MVSFERRESGQGNSSATPLRKRILLIVRFRTSHQRRQSHVHRRKRCKRALPLPCAGVAGGAEICQPPADSISIWLRNFSTYRQLFCGPAAIQLLTQIDRSMSACHYVFAWRAGPEAARRLCPSTAPITKAATMMSGALTSCRSGLAQEKLQHTPDRFGRRRIGVRRRVPDDLQPFPFVLRKRRPDHTVRA